MRRRWCRRNSLGGTGAEGPTQPTASGIASTIVSVRPRRSISLLMIAVGAGASGCLNMWWDADIDALMTRTAKRPINCV